MHQCRERYRDLICLLLSFSVQFDLQLLLLQLVCANNICNVVLGCARESVSGKIARGGGLNFFVRVGGLGQGGQGLSIYSALIGYFMFILFGFYYILNTISLPFIYYLTMEL